MPMLKRSRRADSSRLPAAKRLRRGGAAHMRNRSTRQACATSLEQALAAASAVASRLPKQPAGRLLAATAVSASVPADVRAASASPAVHKASAGVDLPPAAFSPPASEPLAASERATGALPVVNADGEEDKAAEAMDDVLLAVVRNTPSDEEILARLHACDAGDDSTAAAAAAAAVAAPAAEKAKFSASVLWTSAADALLTSLWEDKYSFCEIAAFLTDFVGGKVTAWQVDQRIACLRKAGQKLRYLYAPPWTQPELDCVRDLVARGCSTEQAFVGLSAAGYPDRTGQSIKGCMARMRNKMKAASRAEPWSSEADGILLLLYDAKFMPAQIAKALVSAGHLWRSERDVRLRIGQLRHLVPFMKKSTPSLFEMEIPHSWRL